MIELGVKLWLFINVYFPIIVIAVAVLFWLFVIIYTGITDYFKYKR